MNYNFIEIGTSDFQTEIQKKNKHIGISIDPIQYYIDNLPNKDGCIKKCLAISNTIGFCDCYHIPTHLIQQHKLSKWLSGCNSINNYHPTALKQILKKGLDPNLLFTKTKVRMTTLYSLMIEENVKSINYLKIDTEGHDYIIINKFLQDIVENDSYKLLPMKIKFECNSLTDTNEVDKTINELESFGFEIYTKNKTDCIMIRQLIVNI